MRGVSATSGFAPLLSLVNLEMAPQKSSSPATQTRAMCEPHSSLWPTETRFVQSYEPHLPRWNSSLLLRSPSVEAAHPFAIEIPGVAGPSSTAAFGITPQRNRDKDHALAVAFDDITFLLAGIVFTGAR